MAGEDSLISSIIDYQVEKVEEALEFGADISFVNYYPLRLCIEKNREQMFLLLIKDQESEDLFNFFRDSILSNNQNTISFLSKMNKEHNILDNMPNEDKKIIFNKLL